MRISKLMLPAVTVAGALALAGCGGGSGGTTTQMGSDTTDCTDADGNTFKIPGKDAECPPVNPSPMAGSATAAQIETAKQTLEGIARPRGTTTPGGTEAADAGTGPGSGYVVAAAYDRDDDEVTVRIQWQNRNDEGQTVSGNELRDDEGGTLSADGDVTLTALSGWNGKAYSGVRSGDEKDPLVAHVYSTPRETRKFSEQYAGRITSGELGFTGITSGDSKIGIDGLSLTVGYRDFKPDEDSGATKRVIPGSYDGAPGDYTCTIAPGETCRVSYDATGLLLEEGTWTFKPDSLDALVTDSTKNQVYYGWWSRSDDKDEYITTSAFYGSTDDSASAGRVANTDYPDAGTATYKGNAVGGYAIHSELAPEKSESGHFTANASLTATFGGTGDKLTGTIDGFMVAEDPDNRPTSPRSDWEVTLETTTVNTTSNLFVDGETTWKIGETEAESDGAWQAGLYNQKDGVPSSASGWFQAEHGSSYEMIGAFGANR